MSTACVHPTQVLYCLTVCLLMTTSEAATVWGPVVQVMLQQTSPLVLQPSVSLSPVSSICQRPRITTRHTPALRSHSSTSAQKHVGLPHTQQQAPAWTACC